MTAQTNRSVKSSYQELEDALLANEFKGKISINITDRIAVSTDNSIYQILPDMYIKPEDIESAVKALRIMNWPAFSHLKIAVRAGGTGTNGQSLNSSIVLDLGKHLNKIREVNFEEQWIEVDSGIVLSDLNAYLGSHNLFFAPTTSTANRCSIGGMIGTDAAGKGSRIYGKTSDHVLALDVLLANGERIWLEPQNITQLGRSQPDILCQNLYNICMSKRMQIKQAFPRLNRRLSGYDLETCVSDDGVIDPTRILCGSEGTLAIVLGARLKLTKVPKFKTLVVLAYADFIEAVSSAQSLLPFNLLQ